MGALLTISNVGGGHFIKNVGEGKRMKAEFKGKGYPRSPHQLNKIRNGKASPKQELPQAKKPPS
jgi:hypothetical protein